MSKITTESTAKDNQQQIDWVATVVYNSPILIVEYILVWFFHGITERVLSEFNFDYGTFLLNLVGEKTDYNGLVYGSWIKVPILSLFILNIIILLVIRKSVFKLKKYTK
jgi:hypothetical protein